jgi:hypothetical protein
MPIAKRGQQRSDLVGGERYAPTAVDLKMNASFGRHWRET